MLTSDVERAVARIRDMAGDPEAAHSAEDELHQEVLAAIRDGEAMHPAECAEIALKTLEIDFPRWCA